jgi:hypothetical protein
LHRWVLLKNSIIRSLPLTTSPTSIVNPDVNHVYSPDEADEEEEVDEADSFMFPDGGKLVDARAEENDNASEAEWLDSLLETLGDEEEDEFTVDSDVHVSTSLADDDEDLLLSPLVSPMSSSDDLVGQATYIYYPPPIAIPYPVPYPPFHPPPLTRSYELDSHYPTLDSSPPSYENALPYCDLDDVEDLSVPEAIEDTSDDESDVPNTPSVTHSGSTSSLVDPASIPLPAERSRRRRPPFHIYVDPDDSYFYPFELDPLPFPDNHLNSAPFYQEC